MAGESLVGPTATDAAMLLPRAASYSGCRSSLFGYENGKASPSVKTTGKKLKMSKLRGSWTELLALRLCFRAFNPVNSGSRRTTVAD